MHLVAAANIHLVATANIVAPTTMHPGGTANMLTKAAINMHRVASAIMS
jgi:hypothetical protein